jgi:hypothetical protein
MNSFDGIVSLLVACIELVIVINLLIFAEKNATNKLSIGMLALLFGYQFLEFLICSVGLQSQLIIYFAFFDITLLPPLGLYTVLEYSGKLKNYHKYVFVPALFFIIYYPFVLNQFAVTKCTVLYASYNYPLGSFYAVCYYLPVLATMLILNKKWGSDTDPRQKKNTRLFFFGYLFTFLPAMIIALLIPSFIIAVESLLCKMAFVLAVFVFIFVLKNRTIKNPESK